MTIPKEIHTLNDAILAAAKELSTRPKGRRRIIYVISDGKEYGSKATFKEVLRYLETNKIAVYGTLVGDSARWGEGYISRIHLPFTMYDNLLAKYILATGGAPDFENGVNGIEKSYAKIAEEARNQYTLGYYRRQGQPERPGFEVTAIDGKFRKIDSMCASEIRPAPQLPRMDWFDSAAALEAAERRVPAARAAEHIRPLPSRPNPLPSSGSRLAPKSRKATIANTIRCHGCNISPIDSSSTRRVLARRTLSRFIVAQSRSLFPDPCSQLQFTCAGRPSRSVTITKKARRSSSSPTVSRR
jgi:hypothetical protein